MRKPRIKISYKWTKNIEVRGAEGDLYPTDIAESFEEMIDTLKDAYDTVNFETTSENRIRRKIAETLINAGCEL